MTWATVCSAFRRSEAGNQGRKNLKRGREDSALEDWVDMAHEAQCSGVLGDGTRLVEESKLMSPR